MNPPITAPVNPPINPPSSAPAVKPPSNAPTIATPAETPAARACDPLTRPLPVGFHCVDGFWLSDGNVVVNGSDPLLIYVPDVPIIVNGTLIIVRGSVIVKPGGSLQGLGDIVIIGSLHEFLRFHATLKAEIDTKPDFYFKYIRWQADH
jgi:hypothetical protein